MFANESTVLRTVGQVHTCIEVIEQNHVRYLRFGSNGGWQGALSLTNAKQLVFPYQRAFWSLVEAMPAPRRFLSLGVGVGTALRTVHALHPECELYGVEIDETVVNIAIEHFDSPSHHDVNYWIGDGVTFLCNVDLTFDLIFVDAYMRNQIYSACLEPAFARVLHAALTQRGVAAANLITHVPPTGQVQTFLTAAQAAFPTVQMLPVGIPLSEQNTLTVLARDASVVAKWEASLRQSSQLSWLQRVTWPNRLHTLS
ncbi:spermidine synthase [Alicyclobacillus cycloheptanicus]|jgi:spermidine synthase|uniref:Spermidine synthase n=1 Tax=Alicyclobacillus cycloheptanicus TaxID=1457 RepID=A0ABT9XDS9_9BACL|nr:spermidine synthase [Alicyclobacillus cycloheptanicus]MDQ0188442.1 spermidine synthase [Alicyclobacillus cycloheptanicus]WDM01140.1 spermidine synthase [Alicyclobacillus cycloheptanicus]